MGQLISGPVTLKDTKCCQNGRFSVAASSMQGWRVRMEDSFTCFLNLPDDPSAAYFAIFDGHGGTSVPEYAALHLHTAITSLPEYAKGNVEKALRLGFLSLDSEMRTRFSHQHTMSSTKADHHPGLSLRDIRGSVSSGNASATVGGTINCNRSSTLSSSIGDVGGSTCIVLLVRDGHIYCANCGDSRAVISSLGVAEAFSTDHKPSLPRERSRILAAGGWISGGNRVNGNLALSRALGDFTFKRNPQLSPVDQIISPEPEVTCRDTRPEEDEFIVMGCDGIWDVLTDQEVVSFVRSRLAAGSPPDSVSLPFVYIFPNKLPRAQANCPQKLRMCILYRA
uniref:protein-serine/threonine phosphatase n=1 Tax=Schistocephalus solidus TaxID=70667 RepID=A0A0X3P3B1_SCHSO